MFTALMSEEAGVHSVRINHRHGSYVAMARLHGLTVLGRPRDARSSAEGRRAARGLPRPISRDGTVVRLE